MRRAGLAILAAAALLASAVPAWSGDGGEVAPVAELSVSPQSMTVGEPAALDASASRDPDGSVASYAWDLDGDGAFERQSGGSATLAHAFEEAGERTVGVRVLDDSGQSADARATVVVAEEREAVPAEGPKAAEPAEPAAEPSRAAPPKAAGPDADQEPEEDKRAQRKQPDRVRAAASRTVSITDFAFAPKSVTVSVGDSVTWRNNGDEPHTATARNGSFDTGNLASGQSGSATFNKAGTVSYFCKPHPFMTATVNVTGGGGSGGGGGGSGGGGSGGGGSGGGTRGATGTGESGSAATPGAGTGGDSLPSTGLALAPFLLIGFTMLGSGVALRRRCATPAA